MKTIRILILEDDLETISVITKKLHVLEEELSTTTSPKDFSVVTLSEYTQVESYINSGDDFKFDIVLLDRDCKAGGSFHVLEVERFGVDKIISISSIPEYNEQARKRGVKRIVHKTYEELETFSDKLIEEIKDLYRSR